jgi:hypothetical protein
LRISHLLSFDSDVGPARARAAASLNGRRDASPVLGGLAVNALSGQASMIDAGGMPKSS